MHDKLHKLLKETIQFTHTNGNHIEINPDVATDAVIKLFADEGYTNDIYRKHFNDAFIDGIKQDAGLMTGQEWLDRFSDELDEWAASAYSQDCNAVLQAARRASGITEAKDE